MKHRLLSVLPALLAVTLSAAAQPAAPEQPAKPTLYMVSNAHLDTQWNWDIQTTIREYVRNTLYQNLLLMRKYPDYIFNFEGGVKYAWMKEYYPDGFEALKPFVAAGRWHICGSGWDATDTLVPSPESALRNILLGQEFYRSEFGVESTDIFLPDCFGFGWTLPSIAAHCGLIGFSSQKLGWRQLPFHDGRKYPFPVGLWQGIDGSCIMMAHGYKYSKRWPDEDLTANAELLARMEETNLGRLYHYYGTGDIGGSPTMASVSAVERSLHGDGPLRIVSAASDQLYRDYLPYADHPELPRYDGELLMDVHGTGCYTSQAAMKLYNRQNELLGDAAERASVAAALTGTAPYPAERLTAIWRRVIFHQFHDDLTGTSIPRAYEFSWNDELLSLKQFSDILTHAAGAVAEELDTRVKGTPVVIFNASGHEATDVVEIALEAPCCPQSIIVTDPRGRRASAQPAGYADGTLRLLVEVTAPANGFAVYDVRLSGRSKFTEGRAAARTIENRRYRLTVDEAGDVVSLVDKRHGRELVQAGKAIRLALFPENESFAWPAWEILKRTVDAEPCSITEEVNIALVENGPLRRTLCIDKRCGPSHFRQYIRLYEGALADRIDFCNEVNWQSSNALLKAEFPLAVANDTATYDLGLGTIRRGNNRDNAYEVYAQQWADLTDRSDAYGVTVMNDCKYGWDKPDDHTLRLTLLHTPKTDRSYTYQNRQDFGYHTFTYSLTGHAGPLQQTEARRHAEGLNQPLKAFSAGKHAGTLGRTYSAVVSDNPHVAIRALKRAEGSDEFVVRLYESGGEAAQQATLTFAAEILAAAEADGTEKSTGTARFEGRQLQVAVNPNGIATYKVRLATPESRRPDQQPLALPYDKKCLSWNEMPGEGDFEGGYSYAAELVPEELTAGGVTFRLENRALLNGLQCRGNTLALPEAGRYNRLWLLAATAVDAADGSVAKGTVRTGSRTQEIAVPSYTGFIGQWGHTGHTEGYLKRYEVAYVGTHRHSADGDQPYEFTYMFKYAIDLPADAAEVTLPDNPDIVIFAATLEAGPQAPAKALSTLFRTAIDPAEEQARASGGKTGPANLLKPEQIIGWSGFVNQREQPAFLVDGDLRTKWCDASGAPAYVDFDLGEAKRIRGWKLVNAAAEQAAYVTASALLQGRNSDSEAWQTLDCFTGNRRNVVRRTIGDAVAVRYLRLFVVQPMQTADSGVTRIYELEVYDE